MDISKKKKIGAVIMLLVILLTVCLILANSLQDQQTSGNQSMAIVEVIKPIIDSENKIPKEKFHFSLRKLGHFSEFFLFSLEICILYHIIFSRSPKLRHFPTIIFMVMSLGLIDETVQIFSGRGSMVADVWIDTAGGITSLILYCLIFALVCHHTKTRSTQVS